MASGTWGDPNVYTKAETDTAIAQSAAKVKTINVIHGTIAAGQSSTVQIPDISTPIRVVGIEISGSYNSDCVVWAHYLSGTTFVSRVKNTGANAATNIEVVYHYF